MTALAEPWTAPVLEPELEWNEDIGASLAASRWIRRKRPFPHIVAYDVFTASVYQRLEQAFLTTLEATRGRDYLVEHDIKGRTIDPGIALRFAPVISKQFHDLLARVLGIQATGHVACGVHHHAVNSSNGFPHNDLNPGWFIGKPAAGRLKVSGPAIDYTTGTVLREGVGPPHQLIRAAAMLYYVANPYWELGDGGTTGLYTSARDPVDKPAAAVAPINNSMLLFECTPTSFHGFISNHRHPRNSIIMWLHRPREEVVARWGEDAIVPYGRHPKKDQA